MVFCEQLASDLTKQDFVKDSVGFGEALFNSTLSTLENVGKSTMDTVTLVVNESVSTCGREVD